MADLVSIITPAYQAEAFIHRCVSSVLAQTYVDWEMLLVSDDGCNYRQLLEDRGIRDPRLRFLTSGEVQSGPNHARNIGLAAAQGSWIAPLDADDIYFSSRLEKLMNAAQDTGLAIDNAYVVLQSDNATRTLMFPDKPDGKFEFEDFEQSRAPLLFLFHRGLILHGWDEDVERGGDTLFNLRGLEAANYARFVAAPLHEYQVHNNSICHRPDAAQKFDAAYQHTINRLGSDGLGFKSSIFRQRIIDYLSEKMHINQQFESALKRGFLGNYQQFVSSSEMVLKPLKVT